MLDEPEAALSVERRARAGRGRWSAPPRPARSSSSPPTPPSCSPARARGVYELDEDGVAERAYDDLQAVRFTRGFLEAPERYLRAALEGGGR